MKPSPESFKVVLEHYHLVPNEVLFIDDRSDNIDAAIELGINGIVFTDTQTVSKLIEEILSK